MEYKCTIKVALEVQRAPVAYLSEKGSILCLIESSHLANNKLVERGRVRDV
jgi:hypothetical protein